VNLGNEYGSVPDGLPCWHNYSKDIHDTEEDYEEGDVVKFGLDCGRQPAATLGFERNGGYIIFDEFCSDDMSAEIFAPNFSAWLLKTWGLRAENIEGFADPSGRNKGQAKEQDVINEMISHGFKKIRTAPVKGNAALPRRKAMINPFGRMLMNGKAALRIHQRCKVLRAGARGKFRYKKIANSHGADTRHTEEPFKNFYSHTCESAEYLMVGYGEGAAYESEPKKKSSRKTLMPNRSNAPL